MSDAINFQTRICPTCFDDHSAENPCNLDDLFIDALKGLRDHITTIQADLSQVKKANELLSERLTEAAHNYWKKCEQLREAEKVIESTSSMLLTWFGEQKVFKDFSERAREYQRKYKRE